MKCTQWELDCIRFYMGDLEIVNRGDFYGGPKAYNTINALLHDGIVNELDKIKEGKPIEIYHQEHLKQTVSLIHAIDHALNKMKFVSSPLVTYRVDRMSEIDLMKKKMEIEGFTSTCKYGFLSEYAHTKQNVVLMVFEREMDVPCLDFELLFQKMYAKPEEAEILLPFDCEVKMIEEIELTEEEKNLYHDMNGNPPQGKYRILLGKRKEKYCDELLVDELCSLYNAERIAYCLQELSKKKKLHDDDKSFYLEWKKNLKRALSTKVSL